jgi:hypothetical protein
MRRLVRLASSGEVEVHVPQIVRREFVTKRQSNSTDTFANSRRGLSEVAEYIEDEQLAEVVADIRKTIDTLLPKINQGIDAAFDKWLTSINGTLIALEPEAMQQMLDAYFEGSVPFRSPKRRDDIPDALVFGCAKSIAAKHGAVHFVTEDTQFLKSLSREASLISSKSLDVFFESHEVKDLTARLDSGDARIGSTKEYLSSPRFLDRLSAYLRSENSPASLACVKGESNIEGLSVLKARPSGPLIDGAKPNTIDYLSLDEPTYLKDGEYSMACSITAKADVYYHTPLFDFMELGDEDLEKIFEIGDDDEIVELREERKVRFLGQVLLMFDPTFDQQKLERTPLVERGIKTDNGINVEIEFERATIL